MLDVNIEKRLRDNKSNNFFWKGIFIWSITALFYFFDNLLNVLPGSIKPQLYQILHISASELGILSSCYLWSYGIMQIPAGILVDNFGPRNMLSLAGLSCVIGTILFSIADSIVIACLGRILTGFGASFAVVGCSKIASIWFHPNRFALFLGLMVSVGMLGGAFGLSIINPIIKIFGWYNTIIGIIACSLLISIMLWIFVHDNPPHDNQSIEINKSMKKQSSVSIFQGLKEILTCSQIWIAAIYAGFMFVPTLAFGGLWGIPYLVEAHHFAQSDAGILISLIFFGWVFGGPIYGWLSDYINRRKPPLYFANISTLLISLWLIYGSDFSFLSLSIGMFLLGLVSSGFPIAFVIIREKNRPEISGTVIGFMNMINTFSVAFLQWFIGWLLDITSSTKIIGQKFSLLDYQKSLICIPICLVIAFTLLLKVEESYCILKYER